MKMTEHKDYLDVFPVGEGQINISYINSTKHIVAWHKHESTNRLLGLS